MLSGLLCYHSFCLFNKNALDVRGQFHIHQDVYFEKGGRGVTGVGGEVVILSCTKFSQ